MSIGGTWTGAGDATSANAKFWTNKIKEREREFYSKTFQFYLKFLPYHSTLQRIGDFEAKLFAENYDINAESSKFVL